MRTAVTAMSLAAAGFLVPFMFVYGPPLLLVGPPAAVALAIVSALIGVTGLAAAVIGHTRRPLRTFERLASAAAATILLLPGMTSDAIGIIVLAIVFRRGAGTAEATPAATRSTTLIATKP